MVDYIIALIDYYILKKAFKCDVCKRIVYGSFGHIDKNGKRNFVCHSKCKGK